MERVIREITERLIKKLPSNREFYNPEDLQVLDIPEFITERVVIEMDQNLHDSLATPSTEWASMDTEAVQFAWKNFIEAIKAEVKMPSAYAGSLIETAVADTLDLAIRPRQAIPESLFGVDKELTIETVKKRLKYITVGRKLAAALVRYMEKKGKEKLTLNECMVIVAKVDEKLISGFNSLDWAKETEALFQMAGPSVDSELFRIYFEDKNLPKYAKKFDMLNGNLNRTEFIEVLSAPGPDEMDEVTAAKQPANEPEKKGKPDKHASQKKPDGVQDRTKVEKKDLFMPDDSILNSFQRRRFGSIDEEDEPQISEPADEAPDRSTQDSDEKPLHERFAFDEEAEEQEDSADHSTIYDEMNLKKEDLSDDSHQDEEETFQNKFDPELLKKWETIGGAEGRKKEAEADEDTVLSETEKPDENKDEIASIELYNETDDDEEVPMWRAFLEREDLSRLDEHDAEEAEGTGDEISESEPIIDLTKEEISISEKISEIEKWIGVEKNRFCEEIFDGSETAYEDALDAVLEFDDWKNASKYIQKEIFTRNRIDVFDEVAVDFTDRLHTFFLEYKS